MINNKQVKELIRDNSINSISLSNDIGVNKIDNPGDYQLVKSKFETLVNEATSNLILANKRYKDCLSQTVCLICEGKIKDSTMLNVKPNMIELAIELETASDVARTVLKMYNSLFPEEHE